MDKFGLLQFAILKLFNGMLAKWFRKEINTFRAPGNHKGLNKNKICGDVSELSSFVGNPVNGSDWWVVKFLSTLPFLCFYKIKEATG